MAIDQAYPVDPKLASRIDNDFMYHKPTRPDQIARFGDLRAQSRNLAFSIARWTPPGREQSLALTKIEEALMWAIAAIARNESAVPPTE